MIKLEPVFDADTGSITPVAFINPAPRFKDFPRTPDMTPVEGVIIGPFLIKNLPYQRSNIDILHISGESGHFNLKKLEEVIQEFWNEEF